MKLIDENDVVLTTVSEELTGDLTEWQPIFWEMYALMCANNGIGLAANQVGISKRFFLMKHEDSFRVYINPKIVESPVDLTLMDEGCLSFKGIYLKVKRHDWVKVEYTTSAGEIFTEVLHGQIAQCFQHELEHLDGVVFTSKVAKMSLDKAKEKRTKNLKKLNRR